MRYVRGHREGRLLPSRHDFALFRLAAYVRLRVSRSEPDDSLLAVERHQSTLEALLVGLWFFLTAACYLAASVFHRWPRVLGITVGFAVAIVLQQFVMMIFYYTLVPLWHAVTRKVRHSSIDLQSTLFLLSMTVVSAGVALGDSWVRFIAWQFLGVIAVNAVAALIVFALRHRIAALESSLGGSASAP